MGRFAGVCAARPTETISKQTARARPRNKRMRWRIQRLLSALAVGQTAAGCADYTSGSGTRGSGLGDGHATGRTLEAGPQCEMARRRLRLRGLRVGGLGLSSGGGMFDCASFSPARTGTGSRLDGGDRDSRSPRVVAVRMERAVEVDGVDAGGLPVEFEVATGGIGLGAACQVGERHERAGPAACRSRQTRRASATGS